MVLKVYNTLSRSIEAFEPLEEGRVHMYVCGPTVYNYIHIGNARPFILFDVVRRYLQYRGYQVTYVQNITDIDDKMIDNANQQGVSVKELADRFSEAYFQDIEALKILRADVHPKATEHIPEIIKLISKLEEKGYTYVVDGNMYYKVLAFPEYGRLSHQNLDGIIAGARVEVDERKQHPADFALWKTEKPGEPSWESPWGRGRPGWHIECSAMATKYLGESFDIHAGGVDLIFPHHENEIAQSEGATGKPFVKYWLHNAFLQMEKEKMSKSLGNIRTVREILQRYEGETIRLFMLTAHYRAPISFSWEYLDQAKAALGRITNAAERIKHTLRHLPDNEEFQEMPQKLSGLLEACRQHFTEAMDNDFNTPEALAAVFELIRQMNSYLDSGETPNRSFLSQALTFLRQLASVFGISQSVDVEAEPLSPEEMAWINEREEARKRKDWAKADQIREVLSQQGVILEDTPEGVRWRRKG